MGTPARISDDELEARVIELWLGRVTKNGIARQFQSEGITCGVRRITTIIERYLTEGQRARLEHTELLRQELIARQDNIAADARRAVARARTAGEHGTAARWASVEREALKEVARLAGVDVVAPMDPDMSDPGDALADRMQRLAVGAPSAN